MLMQHARKIGCTRIAQGADYEAVKRGQELGACVGVGGGPPGRYRYRPESIPDLAGEKR